MSTITKAANAHTVVTTGWTNPSNAFATSGDNIYATAVSVQNGTVNGDFGFANFTTSEIPDGSTINSVTVLVEWGMTASVTGGTLGVQLRNNGVNLGTETTKTTTTEAQSTQQVTTGISLSDLRSASTLIKARARTSKGNVATAMTGNLDFMTLTVDFTPPPMHFPQQVSLEARRSYQNKNSSPGRVLIQGNLAWSPLSGTEGFTLPLLTFAASATVDIVGTLSASMPLLTFTMAGSGPTSSSSGTSVRVVLPPKKSSRFRGWVQLIGLEAIQSSTTGTAGFTLPLLTMQIAGQGPTVFRTPAIIQLRKAALGNLSGGFTQLGRIPLPVVETNTLTLALPLLQFASAGIQSGNDLAFSIPKVTFSAVATGNDVSNAEIIFIQKPALPKFKGYFRLYKPARLPLAVGAGSINTTLPLLQFAASASVPISGTLALNLPKISFAASTDVGLSATIALQLPLLQFVSSATINTTGTLGFTIPLLQFNLSEGVTALSQLLLTLPRLLWRTTGEVRDLDGSLLGPGPTSGQLFPR